MVRPTVIVDSSDESSDDESSSSRASNALVDDEAIDVDDSDAESSDSSETVDIPPQDQFHQFMRFPIEIRRHIWDMFCPDVADKHPRILHLSTNTWPTSSGLVGEEEVRWSWKPALALEDQTEQLRKLASIHSESRQIVTKAFPDTILIEPGRVGDGYDIRFNPDRDIVFVDPGPQGMADDRTYEPWPGTCENIQHICFNLGEHTMDVVDEDFTQNMFAYLDNMPSLETLMLGLNPYPGDEQYRLKGWLACEQTVEARFNTYEKSAGLGEDLEWAFIWPDYEKYPEFLESEVIPPWLEEVDTQRMSERFLKVVPMLVFDFDHLGYLDRLKERYSKRQWDLQEAVDAVDPIDAAEFTSENSGDDDDAGPNEYESDGINDDTIEQWDDHSEDELIPPPISSGGPISISGDSDDSDNEVEAAGEAVHSPEVGNFSSPEPDSEDDNQQVVPQRPKRKIVSDSDDDDDDDDEPAAKRTKTRPVAISSDDEEDDDVQPRSRGGSRTAPQVISDAESSDDDSDGDSDDDDVPAKPLSLQTRLSSALAQDAVAPRDDNDDDSDGGSDDANSFCSYADGEDDEDEEEDSEGGEGVLDTMAGQSDDDGGDGDEDSFF